MDSTQPQLRTMFRFSVARLNLVTAVYSLVLAWAVLLPPEQVVAALLVTTVFVVIDLASGTVTSADTPGWSRAATGLAHYSTAFAYTVAACGLVYAWTLGNLETIGSPPISPLGVVDPEFWTT